MAETRAPHSLSVRTSKALHFDPLEEVLLYDKITLKRSALLKVDDMEILAKRYEIELTPSSVEKIDGAEYARFEDDALLTAFTALTTSLVKMFSGEIPFSNESDNKALDASTSWELIFAGRTRLSLTGLNKPRHRLTIHSDEFIIGHLWRLPSAQSLLEMMERLRSNVPYSLLQKFIELEEQNLLTPAANLSGLVPTASGGPTGTFLHTHVRLAEVTDIYKYIDTTDWTQDEPGWDLLAFYQALTGPLNSFDHIWELPPSTSSQATTALPLLEELIRDLKASRGFDTWITSADQIHATLVDPMPYNPTWNVNAGSN